MALGKLTLLLAATKGARTPPFTMHVREIALMPCAWNIWSGPSFESGNLYGVLDRPTHYLGNVSYYPTHIQGFELAHPNIYPICDLLKLMKLSLLYGFISAGSLRLWAKEGYLRKV